MPSEMTPADVFTWLDWVRQRPGMYFTELDQLELLIDGYETALEVHNISERGPRMFHFCEWLQHRTGWSTSCGWARAVHDHSRKRDGADTFFKLLDEFRLLQPTRLAWVVLNAEHRPTGKRVVIGSSGKMRRPSRVDIVRYRPEPLHFLRFHYGRRVVDAHLLSARAGGHRTTLRDAKRWVADELQVRSGEWRSPR
jgi:hypothetical protein